MSHTPSQVQRGSMILLGVTLLLFSGCSGDGGETGGAPGAACQTNCPTAKAGPEQAVVTGAAVTLDGSGSTSGTPGLITYQWTLLSKPAGSAATLVGATTARPTFTADVVGTYDARLVVQEDGASSAPDTVRITCGSGNLAPIADAGPDRTEPVGSLVTLDGTASRDPNGTPITYAWRLVTQPAGSQAVLLNATGATPSFTPHVAGPYTFALTVKDGTLTSPSDEVVITVTANNCPPIADAGADQKVTTGQLVTLTGAGSTDPNHDPLTYSWRFQSKPDGSTATLAAATSVSPTFTADMAGLYVLSLVVNDGKLTSAPDTVVIEARLPSSVNGVLQAYVKASNTTASQFRYFGSNVALDGDTLAVSADEASCATGINGNQANSSCPGAGAVYVFTRTGGTWSQQAYLKASNTEAGARFGLGENLSLSGNTLAVGATQEDSCATGVNGNQANSSCPGAGAVYVFTRTGSTWSQQAYVKASNTSYIHQGLSIEPFFGQAVAVSGNTLVVGAPDEDGCATGINGNQADFGCQHTGAVYIFTRSNSVWTQEAYVKASHHNVVQGEEFGVTVALDVDTLAVGAVFEDSCSRGINSDRTTTSCSAAGAVYVFTRTAGVWTQQAYVKASNTNTIGIPPEGDQFGSTIALKGETLTVGAALEDSCATGIDGNQADEGCPGSGAVYVFTRSSTVWSQAAYVKVIPPPFPIGSFGYRVALDGNTLLVSAPDQNCATGFNPPPGSNDCGSTGAVYLFTRTATSWAQRAYVKSSNTQFFDFFGSRTAISGNTLVVSAIAEDSCATGINGNQNDHGCNGFPPPDSNLNIFGAGAVYVYVLQ